MRLERSWGEPLSTALLREHGSEARRSCLSELIQIWPSVQTQQRQPVFSAHLMVVQGELQNEMNVIHVIAEKVRDYSHWLGKLPVESRDFR